jgi:hypothetical protein
MSDDEYGEETMKKESKAPESTQKPKQKEQEKPVKEPQSKFQDFNVVATALKEANDRDGDLYYDEDDYGEEDIGGKKSKQRVVDEDEHEIEEEQPEISTAATT